MGKTKRNEPRNGQFKKLRGSKKQRNKNRRQEKANLQKHIAFATAHRAAIDMTQGSAAMYMKEWEDWMNAPLGEPKKNA